MFINKITGCFILSQFCTGMWLEHKFYFSDGLHTAVPCVHYFGVFSFLLFAQEFLLNRWMFQGHHQYSLLMLMEIVELLLLLKVRRLSSPLNLWYLTSHDFSQVNEVTKGTNVVLDSCYVDSPLYNNQSQLLTLVIAEWQ